MIRSRSAHASQTCCLRGSAALRRGGYLPDNYRGAFVDDYEPGIASDAEVAAIADHLHRAAHDLRRDERSSMGEPAALTRPLEVLSAPEHWVLIGSLMVDLRRIHDALAPQDG